jgi:hypothetical protein
VKKAKENHMEKPTGKIPWGEFIIPGAAVLYAAVTVTDQIIREFEWKTLLYSATLAIGTLVTALGCVVQILRRGEPAKALSPEERSRKRLERRHVCLFLVWAAFFILSLDIFGYLLTIPVFQIVLFRALGLKSWPRILAFAGGTLLLVHFLFVYWIGLELPLGILQPLFE